MRQPVDFGSDAKLTILIVSPQRWSDLPVSKHHYANALSDMGHQVYFVEPQKGSASLRSPEIHLSELENGKTVKLVSWWLPLPYETKFHFSLAYKIAARWVFNRIVRTLPSPPDLIWDFDNTGMFPAYPKIESAFRIWHLVDPPNTRSFKGQDITLATSKSYLRQIESGARPSAVVTHGLRPEFAKLAEKIITNQGERGKIALSRARVATFGNLSHPALDWNVIESVVTQRSEVDFLLIGPHDFQGEAEQPQLIFERLQTYPNVEICGRKSAEELIELIPEISAWFLCYQSGEEIVGGLTSHKVLEFLSTGLPIAMTGQESDEYRELVYVAKPGDKNSFSSSIQNALMEVTSARSSELARKRAAYAIGHTYMKKLERIASLISLA